jgi:dihydroxy-acid dehydratase
MFTANTMSNLAEALGMALPFSGSAPAVFAESVWLAKQTGYRAVGRCHRQTGRGGR